MNPTIFVDSDVFVALVNTSDANHSKARRISNYLLDLKANLFTSVLVVEELVSVLAIKYGLKSDAIRFAREVIGDMNFVNVDPTDLQNSLEILKNQPSAKISLQDCVNIYLVKKHQFDAIFSFDKIYGRNGLTYASEIT